MENRENLDEHDETIVLLLGYAVARAQLFEHAMLKMLEAQKHDLDVPLDQRWAEIWKWLKESAGTTSGRLRVPKPIRKDLSAVVEARNRVAHDSYRMYTTARGNRGDHTVAEWGDWFATQTKKFGDAYNGVMSITMALREGELDDEGLIGVWRSWVRDPVEPMSFPPVAAD
jgi:hypothetical protein